MTDYTKLVSALRFCFTPAGKGCGYCPAYKSEKTGCCRIGLDAADAIEALQAEIRESMQHCAECGDELEAQMPKLGKWIDDEFTSNWRCSVCGEEWSGLITVWKHSNTAPTKERQKNRSKTFQGIADAMAEQWGSLEVQE